MKIVNNYDLIEKINDSKGKIDIKKIFLIRLKRSLFYGAILTGIDSLPGMPPEGVDWNEILKWFLLMLGVQITFGLMLSFAFKTSISIESDSELFGLLSRLREAGIKTDLELLKDSKEDTVEYKFINEDARLKLRENKYILIPTNDGFGGIKDVSVLQEHNVGSKVYVLSLGSPKKYAKPVRVYN